jgi:hypothetical protein
MLALLLALAAAQSPQVPAEKDADPVICTRSVVGAEVGTHMRSKKVCMKKSDWDIVDQHTKETLQSINDRGNNPGRSDNPVNVGLPAGVSPR